MNSKSATKTAIVAEHCGFDGEFETHLTLSLREGDGNSARMENFASAHGMKYAHIVLAQGATPFQPMLSWRADGALDVQLAAAAEVVRQLHELNVEVVRTKIEAAPTNRDVPQSGPCLRPEHYFESHLKLLLDTDADIDAIESAARARGGHLSRNARRMCTEGRAERFATLRRTEGGHAGIARASAELCDQLAHRVREVISIEIEYVVYDSNRAIDAGWLPGDEE
jgi:hypothetical protein